jgi:hypothetical protein
MYAPCPRCRAYVPGPTARARLPCALCGTPFTPTPAERRRAVQTDAEERLRWERLPLCCCASAGVFGVTALLLVAGTGVLPALGPLRAASAWLFPVWIMLLVVLAWLINRLDRAGAFRLLFRSSLAVLAVLLLPWLLTVMGMGSFVR